MSRICGVAEFVSTTRTGIIEIDPTMTEEDLTDRVTEPFGL